MADRTVTARLRLLYNEFTKGTDASAKGLKGIGDEADRTAKRTNDSWQRLGKATANLGDSLTSRVTLPLVGLGGAAVKMATDFNSAFDQMTALAGVSADEVDGLKESVLGLSEATGRGPQELAEALYFIRGAGLSGQTALDALEVSAKAAAAGLGTTVEVANAVTNVINAYGAANISAAQAGDILTASVTAAKVEAAEMAPQFGRLLPVAAELGVGFDDVAGALAFLTVSSGDASQASTGLGGVLRKLLQPSQQGAAALEQVGLKAADLRTMLGERGLDGTVIHLRKTLGDVGFKQLFDDSEAVAAALQMTGDSAEQFQDIMEQTGDSTGALDDAFKRTDNDARKAAVTWAKAQGAMIRLGDAIMPVVTILADLASAAVGFLGHMPDELRTAIVLFGALLAAAGPLLSVTGRMTTKFAQFSQWLETSSLGTGRFSNQVGRLPAVARGAATALAGIGVALAAIEVIAGQRESKVRGWVEDKVGDPGTLREVRSSIAEVKAELDELDNREGKGRLFSLPGDVDIFATGGDADRDERLEQLREALGELEAQEESLVSQEGELAASYVGTEGALAGLNEETSNAVNALQEMADALAAQFDPLLGWSDALVRNQEAQAGVLEAQTALDEAIANHGATSAEAAEAQRNLDAAYRESVGSAVDLTSASAQLTAGIEAGTVSVSDAKAQLATWVDQGVITQATAAAMGREFDVAALKAMALGGTDPNVRVSTSGLTPAQQAIANFQNQLDRLPWSKTVNVNLVLNDPSGLKMAALAGSRATGGPVSKGRLYEVAERGRAELLEMGDRSYLIPGNDGRVVPAGHLQSGEALAGGGTVVNNAIDMRGAIVANDRQFRQMVKRAFNEVQRKERGLNAA